MSSGKATSPEFRMAPESKAGPPHQNAEPADQTARTGVEETLRRSADALTYIDRHQATQKPQTEGSDGVLECKARW